ncbi:MAG: hypothetical protein ACTSPL_03465 [Candidatus Odinarchaeia archaeon]
MAPSRYLLMLELNEQGDISPIQLSTSSFASDKILLVVDEINSTVWLWTGRDISFIQKRMALRMANSLKTFGYRVQNVLIGRGSRHLIHIDESELDDAETKSNYETLITTIKNSNIEGILGIYTKPVAEIGEVRVPKDAVIIKPREKRERVEEGGLAPPPVPTSEAPFEGEEVTVLQSASDEIKDSVKAGILISCVLEEFPEIHIKRITENGKLCYEIELPENIMFKFKLGNSNVAFESEKQGIGVVEKIQRKFNERINLV